MVKMQHQKLHINYFIYFPNKSKFYSPIFIIISSSVKSIYTVLLRIYGKAIHHLYEIKARY